MNEPEVEAREGVVGLLGVVAGLLAVGLFVGLALGLLVMPDLPYMRMHGWMILYLLVSALGVSTLAGFSLALFGLGVGLVVAGLAPWRRLERRPPVETLPPDIQITVREEPR